MTNLLVLLVLVSGAACASGEAPKDPSPFAVSNPDWVESVEPFRVYDNIYFVGSRGLSSFLITTPEGHFLIDGGLPENAGMIAASVKALGYDIRDVKYLLNSHAHFDHSGGLAALKAMTGATMIASEGDRSALEGGFYLGSEDDPDVGAPPVKVDRTIDDGEMVTLGGVTLTARLSPGHTRGCTSWTMQAGGRDVLFFCSATVANNRLISSRKGPPQYEGIIAAYRLTLEKAKAWTPDIFLANHPMFFEMEARRERQKSGDESAFVDDGAFQIHLAEVEAAFEKALAEQAAEASRE